MLEISPLIFIKTYLNIHICHIFYVTVHHVGKNKHLILTLSGVTIIAILSNTLNVQVPGFSILFKIFLF